MQDRRPHPAGIAIEAVRSIREVALPLLIAIVIGAGADNPGRAIAFGALGLIVAVVTGVVRWWSTSWSLDETALHLRSGLLSRDEKVIPRTRISSVDTVQGPLQRLFGVLELRVQTPGGGRDAEIVLRAVSRSDAELLRRELGHVASGPVTEPDVRMRLGLRALVLAALTSPQLGVLVPIAGAIGAASESLLEDVTSTTFNGLPDTVADWLIIAAAVLLLAWLLSFAGAVVAFAGFEVVRDGDRLQIRSGLLSRRAATLPLSRVQGVRIVEGLLREPFGLAALRVETAGYAGQAAVTQTLFPLVPRREVEAAIARLVPALAGPLQPLAPAPARARRSYLAVPLVASVIAAVLIAVLLGDAWPAIPLLLAAAGGLGELRFRAAGWQIGEDRVVLRSRQVARTTLVASTRRLQEHGTRQTPLQRQRRLADIAVAVGSGRRARVRHLDEGTATRLLGQLRPS